MRTDNKALFKLMSSGGSTFPYNELSCTRNGFRGVKWVLTEAKGGTGDSVLFRRCNIYALLVTSFDMPTITQLIVERRALPLPREYGLIMDAMEHWGRAISSSWYRDVLVYLHDTLSRGVKIPTRELYWWCTYLRVQEMLGCLDDAPASRAWLVNAWARFFHRTYLYESRDYFCCCVRSFRFIRDCPLVQAHAVHVHPAEENLVLGEEVLDSSNTTPIPVVPSSSCVTVDSGAVRPVPVTPVRDATTNVIHHNSCGSALVFEP